MIATQPDGVIVETRAREPGIGSELPVGLCWRPTDPLVVRVVIRSRCQGSAVTTVWTVARYLLAAGLCLREGGMDIKVEPVTGARAPGGYDLALTLSSAQGQTITLVLPGGDVGRFLYLTYQQLSLPRGEVVHVDDSALRRVLQRWASEEGR